MTLLKRKSFSMVSLLVVTACAMLPVAAAGNNSKVSAWFAQYDNIRHEAQMSDAERERSRNLMAQGLVANFNSSPAAAQDKQNAIALLNKMVQRYQKASAQMAALPRIGETKKLYDGYSQYFQSAGALFSDYLKVQTNLLARDASGNPIMGTLAQRKSELESLDFANKDLDARLRTKFGIPGYAF